MQKLKTKQLKKLQYYADSINAEIKELQSKKLYEFMILKIPFVDDYRINFISNTNRVSQATELGDILLAGMQDLVSIVVEEGLGIKEYNTSNEEDGKVTEFYEEVGKQYPSYIEFDVATPISKTIQDLKDKDKTDSLYYKELKKMQKKIKKIRNAVGISYKVQILLQSLDWKFIKIIMAVGLTKIDKIDAYSDVERLEEEARKICQELVTLTKDYDSHVQNLTLLEF